MTAPLFLELTCKRCLQCNVPSCDIDFCSWYHCKVPKLHSNTWLPAKALKETSNN
jgi:hypothetical protein